MDKSPDKPMQSKSVLERHVQTVLLGLVMAAIVWSGATTMRLNESSARQDERVTYLVNITEQLRQDLRSLDSAYLPRREAEVYRSEMRTRVDILESKVEQIGGEN